MKENQDLVWLQKQKLNTMELSEAELGMLKHVRNNIGIVGVGGTVLGAVGGYMMTQGNHYPGGSRWVKLFAVASTMAAGACLGFGLGIQSAMEYISRQPGNLSKELKVYQELVTKSRKAGGNLTTENEEDKAFEGHFAKEILNRRLSDPSAKVSQ